MIAKWLRERMKDYWEKYKLPEMNYKLERAYMKNYKETFQMLRLQLMIMKIDLDMLMMSLLV
jgi:hypothetical protein